MKLTKEQLLELENLDLKIRISDLAIQNFNMSIEKNNSDKVNFLNILANEARKQEDKPEDKFDAEFTGNEIIFIEKESKDAIRPD